MNHVCGNGETPDYNEECEECPDCLGTGEIISEIEEGIFETDDCKLCVGIGKIPRSDEYTKEQDYLDDLADQNYDLENE